jgi:hypothetical protein
MTSPSRIKYRPFTPADDAVIMRSRLLVPPESWKTIASRLDGRTPQNCRQRWLYFLSPEIRFEPWTLEEDRLLVEKINEMGRTWTAMTASFQGRSANDLRKRWIKHVQLQTVRDGTKFVYIGSGPFWTAFQQKESKGRKPCPRKEALAILRTEKGLDTSEVMRVSSMAEQGWREPPMPVLPEMRAVSESGTNAENESKRLWDMMTTESSVDELFLCSPHELE